VRFVENHDEERAVAAFGRERSLAAAAVAATVPGLHFFHEGQLEGRKIRLPIQLIRAPREKTDPLVQKFYDRLLAYCDASALHEGEWSPLEILPGLGGDPSYKDILAWLWQHNKERKIVLVNFAPTPSRGRLNLKGDSPLKRGLSPLDIALEAWGVLLTG
jgi:hypothetical protein